MADTSLLFQVVAVRELIPVAEDRRRARRGEVEERKTTATHNLSHRTKPQGPRGGKDMRQERSGYAGKRTKSGWASARDRYYGRS